MYISCTDSACFNLNLYFASFFLSLLIAPTDFSVKSSEIQVNVPQNYCMNIFFLYLLSCFLAFVLFLLTPYGELHF